MTDTACDTTEGRLLRQIAERPLDDAPRLVLADWLEERGDCDRAEFIRTQIELAALPMPETSPNHDRNRDPKCNCQWCYVALPLRSRSQNILDVHAAEWLPSGVVGDRVMAWTAYGTCVLRSPRRLQGEGDWFVTFHRGLPARVVVPEMAGLLEPGPVCKRCAHCREPSDFFDAATESGDCRDCRGTGRLPSPGVRLVRAGVYEFGCGDKRPAGPESHESVQRYRWYRGTDGGDGRLVGHRLPPAVFDRLKGGKLGRDNNMTVRRTYLGLDAAQAALSRSLCDELRHQAELPAVQWPPG